MDIMVKIAWFQNVQNLINLKWTLYYSFLIHIVRSMEWAYIWHFDIVRNRTYVPSLIRWSLWVLGRGALGQRNFAHTQQALVFAKNDTVFLHGFDPAYTFWNDHGKCLMGNTPPITKTRKRFIGLNLMPTKRSGQKHR